MRILILGNENNDRECREKFGEGHEYSFVTSYQETEKLLIGCDVIFDFLSDPLKADEYFTGFHNPVFFNTTKVTLLELAKSPYQDRPRYGFNGMPGFILLPVVELCILKNQPATALQNTAKMLDLEFRLVDDRIGMVTPRIICMIINEAFYTAQDGTASREDIDTAMKLGTHYPFGPFEWCDRIGIRAVYELLEKIYADTHDARYNISPLLKKEYLQAT